MDLELEFRFFPLRCWLQYYSPEWQINTDKYQAHPNLWKANHYDHLEPTPNRTKMLTLKAPWLLFDLATFSRSVVWCWKLKLPSLNLDQAPISNSHTPSFFSPPRIMLSLILCCPFLLICFHFFLCCDPHFIKSVQASIQANALVSSWLSAISSLLVSTAGSLKSSLTDSVLHSCLGTTLGQVWVNFKSPRQVSGQLSLKSVCLPMPFEHSPCVYSTPTPRPLIS